MKITVLIPTKNGETVYDTIESVLSQEYDDFEVLVVDDYSEEEFSQELEEFCSRKDVRYIHKSEYSDFSKGLNGSRNLGIEESDGDSVAFLDDDCVATEGWLEKLAEKLEEHDVVESHVKYVKEGRKCPMDRAIQNSGERYKFLGAGLAFRTEVGEEIGFEERFIVFRGDTSFGFEALEEGYSYGFAEDAVVEHRSGRFSPKGFVEERKRFVEDALFFDRFQDSDHLEKEVSHVGNVLYPKELLYLAAFAAAFFLPFTAATVPLLMGLGELIYVKREDDKRELDICIKDLFLLFFLVPAALVTKRYAIWKGALKYRVPVV